MQKAIDFIEKNIAPLVLHIRNGQNINGTITLDIDNKKVVLADLIEKCNELVEYLPESKKILSAFKGDIDNWLAIGLDKKPSFDRTISEYCPPLNGNYSFFIGVVKNQNSLPPRGYFLEYFFVQREEPICNNNLYSLYPHPANICVSTKLVTGSVGFKDGNCVVFFPENILSNNRIEKQNYALFFFMHIPGKLTHVPGC